MQTQNTRFYGDNLDLTAATLLIRGEKIAVPVLNPDFRQGAVRLEEGERCEMDSFEEVFRLNLGHFNIERIWCVEVYDSYGHRYRFAEKCFRRPALFSLRMLRDRDGRYILYRWLRMRFRWSVRNIKRDLKRLRRPVTRLMQRIRKLAH
jgi:hypothetical protein